MNAKPTTANLIGPLRTLALLISLSAASAQAQVVVDGQRAAVPERSCVQQIRQDGIREADAIRAALDQCMRAKRVERDTQPAPQRPPSISP